MCPWYRVAVMHTQSCPGNSSLMYRHCKTQINMVTRVNVIRFKFEFTEHIQQVFSFLPNLIFYFSMSHQIFLADFSQKEILQAWRHWSRYTVTLWWMKPKSIIQTSPEEPGLIHSSTMEGTKGLFNAVRPIRTNVDETNYLDNSCQYIIFFCYNVWWHSNSIQTKTYKSTSTLVFWHPSTQDIWTIRL